MTLPFFEVVKVMEDGEHVRDRFDPPYAVSKLKLWVDQNLTPLFKGEVKALLVSRGEDDADDNHGA